MSVGINVLSELDKRVKVTVCEGLLFVRTGASVYYRNVSPNAILLMHLIFKLVDIATEVCAVSKGSASKIHK